MAKGKTAANAADQSSSKSGNRSELGEGDLSSAASEAAEKVQETVSGLGDQVRQQATDQVTTQKERVAGGLETVAQLLRQAGQQVREQDQAPVAGSIDGVADRVEQWSDSIRMQDVSQLVDETKQLARRQPALFVGGALALGFLGVRFFKSSPQGNTTTTGQTAPDGSALSSSNTSLTRDADAARDAFFAETPPESGDTTTLHEEAAEPEDISLPSNRSTASAENR